MDYIRNYSDNALFFICRSDYEKNKVKEASAGIDVQLKKRYDLIPNLLNMAAKFMAHESKLMEEITKLRTAAMANSFKDNPQEK